MKTYTIAVLFLFFLILMCSCRNDYTPKPRGYFRIDFPEKKYIKFENDCPFSFEYPDYAVVEHISVSPGDMFWYDISIPAYKAKIHLTYKDVNGNLGQYTEDIRKIAYKHIIKADDIIESDVIRSTAKVFGTIFNISGNTASSINFYLTDSTKHFLSGALYFSVVPNSDSLAPAIKFFQEDVVHLTESLMWK